MPTWKQRLPRIWIGLVGLIAMVQSPLAYMGPQYLSTTVWEGYQVDALASRHYALWTFTSGLARCSFAIDPSLGSWRMSLATFFIALGHFLTEIELHHTVQYQRASISPLIVATLSIVAHFADLILNKEERYSPKAKED
eukprot:Clim_evm33s202 gene=Clim_evmTU33s202